MTAADDILIQAHRGAGNLAPENTLEAFELAWRLGCVPEADVQTTPDGVLAAFHDDDVPADAARMANVFAMMRGRPDRRLYLDIKKADLAQLARELREFNVQRQAILASTRYEILRQWKSHLPQSATLLWMGGSESELSRRFDELRAAQFAEITQLQIHVHLRNDAGEIARDTPDPFVESDAFLLAVGQELRRHGILYQALPYGGSTPGVFAKLLDLGVMSFATDHPEVAREAVQIYFGGREVMSPQMVEALRRARDTRHIAVGAGALQQAAEVFSLQFDDAPAIIVADPNTMRVAGNAVASAIPKSETFVFADPDLYAEHSYVEQLEAKLRQTPAIPVAVGSGTINDLTKLAAHRVGRPYLCVATAASMDGYTAYGASITHHGHKQTFECPAPRAVVADIDIIASAPRNLTASGFADLMAKLTAGADWIVADALGVEPIDPHAWSTVQGGLREALSGSIEQLTEGLIMSGFAMQGMQSSRPASGAEHQFSHLWDMEHATDASHGFKVGVATIAVAKFYDAFLDFPSLKIRGELPRDRIDELFEQPELRDVARRETAAKSAPKVTQIDWPELVQKLRAHLPPWRELAAMLEAAGAPIEPQQIGIPTSRLRDSFIKAYHIRRRFTVLDLAVRAGMLDEVLHRIYPADDE